MDFSAVFKALNAASAFQLFRMRSAINRVLNEPRYVQAVLSRLQVGQAVEYFNEHANGLHQATILEIRRKQVVVLDKDDGKRWLIEAAAINLDGDDVQIREQTKQGLSRNEVAVGEMVGFLDRNHQQRSGKVIRLNDKSVTVLCGTMQWRVSYTLLHRVLETDVLEQQAIEHDTGSGMLALEE